jgi:hypothetical protein
MGSFRLYPKVWAKQAAFAVTIFVAFLGFVNYANAGTIYISPSSGSYTVGSIVTVRIMTSSPAQAINAVSGTLKFPADKMQIVALSKASTIMSLWVQEPSYSNGAGSADFAGVVLNPGFTGSAGQVLTVSFKVTNTGTAKLSFSSGSLLANDGNGTEVLSGLSGAEYTFKPAEVPVAVPAPAPVESKVPLVTPPVNLEAPIIQKYTDSVLSTDVIFVQGTTQPNFTARLYVENPGNRVKVAEGHADSTGAFVITWDQQAAGLEKPNMYYMRVDAISADGSQVTKITNVIPIRVTRSLPQSSLLMIALIACIVAIVVLLIALLLVLYRKKDNSKSSVKDEVKKAAALVHSTFANLKKNLDYYTEVVETTSADHQLSKAEEVIVKRMERNLDEAEQSIESEVEVIGDKAGEEKK